MASALALQCSNQWSYKDSYLAAGQFVEFFLTRERSETQNDDVNCGNNLKGDMIDAVVIAIIFKAIPSPGPSS